MSVRTRGSLTSRQRTVDALLKADYNGGSPRGVLAIKINGVETPVLYFNATQFQQQVASAPLVATDLGSAASPYRDLFLSGFVKGSVSVGLTAHAGGTQAAGLALTSQFNFLSTVASVGDSVLLPASVAGMSVYVDNRGAAAAQVFGAGTDTINGVATATGVPLPAGTGAWFNCNAAGTWLSPNLLPARQASAYAAAVNTTGFTATGAQFALGDDTVLALTGTLGSGQTLTPPTVANLLAAIPNAFVGQTFKLRVINLSGGAFSWTVGAQTGYTLNGTQTIAQNFYRDYRVTIVSLAAITMQSIGTFAQSAL